MDPRGSEAGLGKTRLTLSPLMKAKAEAKGEKVNACPFGCDVADLDDNEACRHLVGYTNATPAEVKRGVATYEPLVTAVRFRKDENGEAIKSEEGRVVQVPMRKDPNKAGKMIPDPPFCEKDDQLVQITSSSRVYRNVDKKLAKKAS